MVKFMHYVLGCRIDICRAVAEREWGWTVSNRTVHVRARQQTALNDEKELVRFTSNTDSLQGILPEAKIYLGHEWLFAWGRDAREILRAHIARGGKVLERKNGQFEELQSI